MVQYEQPDCRRQVAVPALRIDIRNHVRKGHIAFVGDFLKALPEGIFKTHTRLVPGDHD